MNKKEFFNWILSMRGSAHYSGKTQTMYVYGINVETLQKEIIKNNIKTAFKVII